MRECEAEKKRTKKTYLLLSVLLPLFAVTVVFGYAFLFRFCEGWGIPLFDCVYRERLGIYCPGCGGSRALLSLLRLDVLSSLRYYPAMLPTSLLLLDLYVRIVLAACTGKEAYVKKFRFRSFYLMLGIVLLTFLVRNVLWLAFGIDVLGDFSA